MSFHNLDIPLSLYIHIPWCIKKCPYCDFNSHQLKTHSIDENLYIQALQDDITADIKQFSSAIKGRKITSIFIGGGTPSLFSANSLAQLLQFLRSSLSLDPQVEITIEANPNSAEAEKFIGFYGAGINRISIGVQSFSASHLSALGRAHSSDEALKAVSYAKQAGFKNINLDIMFALPQQTLDEAMCDIQTAIDLQPTHLSCYQLTIEPNTLFHHQPPKMPDDDLAWEMQNHIQTALSKANYAQYEVSAYAKENKRCKHNLNYWHFGDYLAIGAGAHGKITLENGDIIRYSKHKHPKSYLQQKQNSYQTWQAVPQNQIPFEFMLNALRLTDGFAQNLFTQRTGLSYALIEENIQKHQTLGLLKTEKKQRIQLTERGKAMLNNLLNDYLIENV